MALTMAQVYAYARQAGFDPASAVIMTAVSMAESGLNPADVGDLDKVDGTWGPSVGLTQIRTRKADTGTGRDRDILWLTGNPVNQLVAAYHISGSGKDFSPWTVYNSGAYQGFMQQAIGAAAGAGRGSNPIPGANVVGDTTAAAGAGGVTTQPVSLTGDVAAAAKDIGILLVLVGLGVALVVGGAVHATGTGGVIKNVTWGAVKTAAKTALVV